MFAGFFKKFGVRPDNGKNASDRESEKINNEGVSLYGRGRLQEAAVAFQKAAQIDPKNPDALANLGIVLARSGQVGRALKFFERSLRIRPEDATTSGNYALALREASRHQEAIQALRSSLALDPGSADRWCDLAMLHEELGALDEARRCCEEALARHDQDVRAFALLASIAMSSGRFDDAEEYIGKADRAGDAAGLAVPFRSFLRLGRYDYAQGWEDYQSRKGTLDESPLRPYPFPEWVGESLAGKKLLVYAEQGLGDEIMFASCIPDAAALAERIVLECDPRMRDLFSLSFPANVRVLPFRRKGQKVLGGEDIGQMDFQVPAGDLPRYFRRSIADFPSGPYLVPQPESAGRWRHRLEAGGSRLRVGIAWRGGLGKTRSQARSLSVESLAQLLGLPGIQWLPLQFRPTAEEKRVLSQWMDFSETWPSFDAENYAELAAMVAGLDLVVSVCGSTVHFAGALGVPVWVPTPYVPEWRYGFTGETMPWYSSVRLFRQCKSGDWDAVVRRIEAELTQMVSQD